MTLEGKLDMNEGEGEIGYCRSMEDYRSSLQKKKKHESQSCFSTNKKRKNYPS